MGRIRPRRGTPAASPARLGGRRSGLAAIAATVLAALALAASSAAAAEPAPAPVETLAPADLVGSGLGSEANRQNPAAADPSGAFVYRKGRYTPLDTVPGYPITSHNGFNNRGQIVGSYLVDGAQTIRGFLRDKRGDYRRIDVPGAAGTIPFDINDRGTLVGIYSRDLVGLHGFLRRPNGGITTVDVPGASSTVASGVNNRGSVVGCYLDGDGSPHGFLLERGILTAIDPPGANEDVTDCNIQAFDVNDRNQIVGFYPDAQGTFHGFLYRDGRFTTIDHPDASDSARSGACDGMGFAASAAFGIDNHGGVVGQYVDAAGVLHGYLWQRKRGFTTIDPPRGGGTVAADINDRRQILLPAPAPVGLSKGDGCF
jgi:probable HAF family extracellular repeat protein